MTERMLYSCDSIQNNACVCVPRSRERPHQTPPIINNVQAKTIKQQPTIQQTSNKKKNKQNKQTINLLNPPRLLEQRTKEAIAQTHARQSLPRCAVFAIVHLQLEERSFRWDLLLFVRATSLLQPIESPHRVQRLASEGAVLGSFVLLLLAVHAPPLHRRVSLALRASRSSRPFLSNEVVRGRAQVKAKARVLELSPEWATATLAALRLQEMTAKCHCLLPEVQ